mgnify:CR=1 FL=1
MIRFGVERGMRSAGKSLQPIAELIEVLCTSEPKALVEMREAYRALYQQDPVDAIRHSLGASLATASAPSSSSASPSSSSAHADAGSAVPLLAQLLEHAPTASRPRATTPSGASSSKLSADSLESIDAVGAARPQ